MKVRLGDVGKIITGSTPKTSDSNNYDSNDIPFIKPSDISDDEICSITKSEYYISEKAREKARILPPGCILISCIGIVGKVGINKTECSFNQQINAIIPSEHLCDTKYVSYAIKFLEPQLQAKANAAVVPILNKSQFSDIQIALPSLEEQRHIAAVLDKVSELISKRKAQLDKLDELVKSRFVEMFGDPVSNPKGWDKGTIRDVITEAKYGTSKPAVEGGTFKYLRMGNITYDGHLDLTDLKYIDIPDSEIEKYLVKKGDVLFNRTNSKELVGKTCVFDVDEPMVIAGYIIRIRVNDKVLPEYLSAVLNSRYGKQTLAEMCKAIVGQANINAQELQNIAILIPPIELQMRFSQLVSNIKHSPILWRHRRAAGRDAPGSDQPRLLRLLKDRRGLRQPLRLLRHPVPPGPLPQPGAGRRPL